MSTPTFLPLDEADFEYGRVDQVSPLVRRVIAENPSKFTYRGTGTYIVGHGDVVVIDPGPVLDSHRDALARALEGERVRAILVTHCHSDHSPLAAWLRERTGAPTVGYGPHPPPPPAEEGSDHEDDRSAGVGSDRETDEEIDDGVRVEETVDLDFVPDLVVRDGDTAAAVPGVTFTAVHTPGHTSNHTCYALAEESALFTGDHVMGWSTTVVSPPDGDMASYMTSLRKVAERDDAVLWPTHGPPRRDAGEYVMSLLAHRVERERQILDHLRTGPATISEMVPVLYESVPEHLHKAAARSVLAHLVKLLDDGLVSSDRGAPRSRAVYELVEPLPGTRTPAS